ncbi:MAG: metalloregulator ArsR/SmtB family transcription factor [Betaproteobacteria bacterium]|nr:metalloregulator ArsR/SmtB family transcription factor [Betaproteobacteria bacterium]MDH4323121.1 metalloregulator ArsR/SmtB family transcription factor [Betaproteobacteria bacterium]
MSTETMKRELYQSIAKVAQALASGNRLQLLEFMAQGERSVDALAAMTGMTVANASQHLQALRRAGVVAARKDGQRVYYRVAGDDVVRLYQGLRVVAESRLAEVRRLVGEFLGDRTALEPVLADELLARAKKGLVTVLDVRPREEFDAGHLPGAVNIPIDRLESELARLPRKLEVVAYCRGPFCLMSFDAVAALRKRGWKARRLEDGFPEWKAAGLPIESSG